MATRLALSAVRWSTGGARQAAEVAALGAQAFDPRYREAWSEGQILSLLCSANSWLDLAHDEHGRLLAFALCRLAADEVELLLCATHPAYRRQGLGRQLIEHVQASSRQQGGASLFLEVRSSNDIAIALYRFAGFAISGRRPGYYLTTDGQRIDGLTLRMALD